MKAEHIGSARSGLGEWLVQRLSAVYMAGFALYFVLRFGIAPARDHAAWIEWFGSGAVRISVGLFFLSAFVHAWIGLRSVCLDYLRPAGLRLAVTSVSAGALLALAFWTAEILLRGGAS